MGNEHSLSHQPTNPHEADQDRDSLTMDTQSTAAVSTTFDAENGESSEERRDLRIVNGGNETTFLPTSLNDEERTDLRTPASDEASIVLESSNGEPNFSHSCEQGGNEKMAEESEKLSVQTRFVVQPDVDAISSTIEVGQAEGMVSSGLKSVDSVPEKGQTKTSEKSHASSVNGQYLQPFDPAIGLLEKNLIELINDHGGRLAVSSWTHAYEQKFGGKTLRKQLTAAGTEKLKQLLPKFQTVTRGDGREESLFLFNRRKKDQRDGSVAPLIALENKLLLVIQGRKGSATMKQLKSDFSDHFGPRALDKALKDSGCSSLEGAIKHMTRISSIKKNKKVVYTCLMTNPEQEVNIPQNGIVQQTDSPSDQQQSAVSFIDSDKKLEIWDETFLQQFLLNESKLIDSGTPDTVALSCRGGSERLYLICLAFSPNDIFVFDSVKLDAKAICEKLGPIFESTKITKLVHDLRYDTAALRTFGSVAIFRGMMDTQLIVEHMRTDFHCSFCDMLDCLQLIVPTSLRLKLRSTPKAEVYLRRPISSDLVSPIFGSLKVLVQSISKIRGNFDSKTWKALGEASDIRASASFTGTRNDPSRRVAFDVSCGYRMVSYELLSMIHPENMMKEQPLEIVQDISTLLNILPDDVQEALSQLDTTHLADIVFDQGRRPHVWIKGKRVMLFGADRLVESKEIESIAERFRFGSDNRAGLERQLHRISAIRNRESSIIGMTVRIGRHVSGNAGMIADLLFDRAGASILFLGEPGSGKCRKVGSFISLRKPRR